MQRAGKIDVESPEFLDSSEDGDGDGDSDLLHDEAAKLPNIPLDEDAFGIAICSLIRDFYFIAKRKGHLSNRIFRLLTTFVLLFGCITIQTFLLYEIINFVSAKAVHDVRIAYDVFERKMYGRHVYATINKCVESPSANQVLTPCHRGIDGHFNASAFWEFDDDWTVQSQQNACRIPLSQPEFFSVILFIWTVTCFSELRKCMELFQSLILNTEVTESMSNSLRLDENGDNDDGADFVVARLTRYMKVIIVALVIVPRVSITLSLVWLGCRWLLGTFNFADLILNAVALEFILLMKDTLYVALVPRRNKLDLANTVIFPATEREVASIWAFAGTMLWAVCAVAWVSLYIGWFPGVAHFDGLQKVLPDYKWDVHEVCVPWVKIRYMQ